MQKIPVYLFLKPRHRSRALLAAFLFPLLLWQAVKAEETHPRLFLTSGRLAEIRQAIQKPGSHHQEAFSALKQKVDRNDIQLFGATETNWNYARAYLAQSAAFLYQLTGERQYSEQAFAVVRDMLVKSDPDRRGPDNNYLKTDPDGRGIDTNYGLSRATVGQGLAYAYDWCYAAWTEDQRTFVRDHLNRALDAWETYRHANLESEHRGSNWVAVCRGGELVMLLAAYRDKAHPERLAFLKNELSLHIRNGYTSTGFTQEGIGYCAYAGTFLLPAVYALQSSGDTSLREEIKNRHWWKWLMFAGSFVTREGSHLTVLQSGVSGDYGDQQGWPSLLLPSVEQGNLPHYLYFYDRYSGKKAPGTPAQKYESYRVGTVWSLLYYPQEAVAENPSGKTSFNGLADEEAGAYYFRNRWQDKDDIHLSLMADTRHHSHAWDQPEALQIVLNGAGTQWIMGPGKERNDALYSTLLVNGRNHYPGKGTVHTGKVEKPSALRPDGSGYVVVSGGEKYDSLGIISVKRHLEVLFSASEAPAILSVRDQIESGVLNDYTFNLNLGKVGSRKVETGRTTGGHPEFTVYGEENARLKGWVVHPADAVVQIETIKPDTEGAETWQALQIKTKGKNRDIWVVMAVGENLPAPRIKARRKKGSLTLGKTRLIFPGTGRPQ